MLPQLSTLFQTPPQHWGLRVEPHLWAEIQQKTATELMPNTSNELEQLLHSLFRELTGELQLRGRVIYIEWFNTGGMSSG